MLNDIDHKILPFRPPRVPEHQLWSVFPQEEPEIPAMPATLLQMDLLMQQRWVELRELKQLVLSDVGVTLEVLRLAASEFEPEERHTLRIEDCICAAGLEECANAIAAQKPPQNGGHPAIMEFWEHSRSVAQYCRMIAENSADLNPDQAYLVGLLHGIGSLPELLGWRGAGALSSTAAGLRLAKHFSVPDYVVDYLMDIHSGSSTSVWSDIVSRAHRSVSRKERRTPIGSLGGLG